MLLDAQLNSLNAEMLCCCPLQHYVSEKLYEAVWAGAVPIYYGATNLESGGYFRPECGIMLRPEDFSRGDGTFNASRVVAE